MPQESHLVVMRVSFVLFLSPQLFVPHKTLLAELNVPLAPVANHQALLVQLVHFVFLAIQILFGMCESSLGNPIRAGFVHFDFVALNLLLGSLHLEVQRAADVFDPRT